jgi:hypothetical protein
MCRKSSKVFAAAFMASAGSAPRKLLARVLATKYASLLGWCVRPIPLTGRLMPRYVFTIRSADRILSAERAAVISDDVALLAYACEFASELSKSGKYDLPNLTVSVGDERRPIVFSIPCCRETLELSPCGPRDLKLSNG